MSSWTNEDKNVFNALSLLLPERDKISFGKTFPIPPKSKRRRS
jgi:hypothetical protein